MRRKSNRNESNEKGTWKVYLYESVFFGTVIFWLYRLLIYKPVFGLSPLKSSLFLIVMEVVTGIVIYLLYGRTKNTTGTVLIAPAVSLLIYCTFANFGLMPKTLQVLSIVGVIAGIGFIGFLLYRHIRDGYKSKERYTGDSRIERGNRERNYVRSGDKVIRLRNVKSKNRLVMFLKRAGVCLSVGIIICMVLKPVFGGRIPSIWDRSIVTDKNSDEELNEFTLETLELLDYERWKDLSLDERMEFAQALANNETRYLGLDREVIVIMKDLDGPSGQYNNRYNTVTLDKSFLESSSPMDVLETVTHEMYHAYEHMLVDIYNNSSEAERARLYMHDAKIYKEELENYNNADSGDVVGYYMQRVESDARNYADDSIIQYFKLVGRDVIGNKIEDYRNLYSVLFVKEV